MDEIFGIAIICGCVGVILGTVYVLIKKRRELRLQIARDNVPFC